MGSESAVERVVAFGKLAIPHLEHVAIGLPTENDPHTAMSRGLCSRRVGRVLSSLEVLFAI